MSYVMEKHSGRRRSNCKKKSRIRTGKDKKYDKKNKMKTEASALDLVCVYCNLSFADKVEFQVSLHNHDFNFWN